MNSPWQHTFMMCCLLFVCQSVFSEEEGGVTEARHERILVKVSVDDSSLESRREAITSVRVDAVKLWLQSSLNEIESATETYFVDRVNHYIVTSEILNESSKAYGGEFEVEVYLDADLLRFDLASYLFPGRAIQSSVLILIGQNFINEDYSTRLDNVGSEMLRKLFSETRFLVMNQEEIDSFYTPQDLIQCLRTGSNAGARMGRAVRCDIVVMGEVRTGEIEEEGSTGKIKGFADVLIIRASDGLLLDRIRAEAIVSGVNSTTVSPIVARDAVYKIQQRVLVAAALGMINQSEELWTHCVIRGEDIKNISSDVIDCLESNEAIDSMNILRRERNALVVDLKYSIKTSALITALGEDSEFPYWLEAVRVVDGGEMVFNLHAHE